MRAALDQLASKVKDAIESQFNAKLTSFTLKRDKDMWGVFPQMKAAYYTLTLSLRESKHKLTTGEYPAHDIKEIFKNEIFSNAIGDSAKLLKVSTNMDCHGFSTELEFAIRDIHVFSEALTNFAWKHYAKQFDDELEETLNS